MATKNFTPYLRSSIQNQIVESLKYNFTDFRVSGAIYLFPSDKKIETEVIYCNISDSTKIKTVKKILNQSFNLWNIDNFKDFETIKIPFSLRCSNENKVRSVSLGFLTQKVSFVEDNAEESRRADQSSNYFNQALLAYKNKDYELAADLFGKSYDIYPLNIDAQYFKAEINFALNNLEQACKDWEILKNLGQMKAKKMVQKNCN